MERNIADYFHFSGNPKSLELTVSLSYVGTSFGNLPSFSQFTERITESRQRRDTRSGRTGDPTKASSTEIVDIRWQQKIQHPLSRPKTIEIEVINQENNEETPKEDDTSNQNNNDESEVNPVTPPPSDPRNEGNDPDVEGHEPNLEHREEEQDQPVQDEASPIRLPVGEPEEKQAEVQNFADGRSRIFTYTDADNNQRGLSDTQLRSARSNEESGVFRPRKVAPLTTGTLRHPVCDLPSAEQSRRQRQVDAGVRTMLIMGYFGPWNEPYRVEDERVLSEVRIKGRHVLQIQPGLGEHTIESRIGTYSIKIQLKKDLDFNSIDDISRLPDGLDDLTDEDHFDFDLPPQATIMFSYNITLDEARNFPHDGLYVEYQLKLPQTFELMENSQASGQTQLCFTKGKGQDEVANFSFPIQFSLVYKPNKSVTTPFFWPRLCFKCLAEDSWQRFHVDGYGSVSLPTEPCSQSVHIVHCWRPVNPFSHLAKLREHFIGQAVDLTQFELAGLCGFDGNVNPVMSKLGISTETSGYIRLTVSCLHQSRHFIAPDVTRNMHHDKYMAQIGVSSSLYWRIRRVLAQFEEAKRHLIRLQRKQ